MAAKLPGSLAAGLSPSTSQCGTATRRGPAGLCHRLGGRHLFPGHLKAAAPLLPHPTLPAPLGPQGAAEPGAPAPPMLEPLSREFLSCPVTQRPCLDLSVVEGWAGQVWRTVSRCFLTSGSWRDPEGHTLPCPHLHWPLPPWSPPSSLWLTPPHPQLWRHPMMPTNLAQGKWPGWAVGFPATRLSPAHGHKVSRSYGALAGAPYPDERLQGVGAWAGLQPISHSGNVSQSFVLPTPPFQRQWWSVKAWELPRNHKTSGPGRSHMDRTVDIDRKKLIKAPVPHRSNGCQGPPSPSGVLQLPKGYPQPHP